MSKTAIVILAAGDSSRLGRPKQLLPYKGKTLIEHVADEAIEAQLSPVIVVTGSHASPVTEALIEKPVFIHYNEAWQTGMASGIVAGLRALLKLNANAEQVILAVCDQPHVSAGLFNLLVSKQQLSCKNIVASGYADTMGVPVLYTSKYFQELQLLKGEEGSKKLLRRFEDDVAVVDFPLGAVEIDTMEDYEMLIESE